MIHRKKITVSEQKTVEHYVAPCIKCQNDDISVEEYEDAYGFISKITCRKCKNIKRVNCHEEEAIRQWNNENDIDTVISNKKKLIRDTKKEIIIISRQRLKNKKCAKSKK